MIVPEKARPLIASVTPEVRQRNREEVAQENTDRLDTWLHEIVDYGAEFWYPPDAPKRLHAYVSSVNPDEGAMIMTEGYREQLRLGLVPPLRPTLDSTGGPSMFFIFLQLPDWVFDHYATDFRNLWNAAWRRAEAG